MPARFPSVWGPGAKALLCTRLPAAPRSLPDRRALAPVTVAWTQVPPPSRAQPCRPAPVPMSPRPGGDGDPRLETSPEDITGHSGGDLSPQVAMRVEVEQYNLEPRWNPSGHLQSREDKEGRTCRGILVIQGNISVSHREQARCTWPPHTLGACAGEGVSHHDTAGAGGCFGVYSFLGRV